MIILTTKVVENNRVNNVTVNEPVTTTTRVIKEIVTESSKEEPEITVAQKEAVVAEDKREEVTENTQTAVQEEEVPLGQVTLEESGNNQTAFWLWMVVGVLTGAAAALVAGLLRKKNESRDN